jgi:hypothetical protein
MPRWPISPYSYSTGLEVLYSKDRLLLSKHAHLTRDQSDEYQRTNGARDACDRYGNVVDTKTLGLRCCGENLMAHQTNI